MKKIYGVHLWVQLEQNDWKSSYIASLEWWFSLKQTIVLSHWNTTRCIVTVSMLMTYIFRYIILLSRTKSNEKSFLSLSSESILNQAENDFINKWMCNSVHVTAHSSNHLNTYTSHTHTHSPNTLITHNCTPKHTHTYTHAYIYMYSYII